MPSLPSTVHSARPIFRRLSALLLVLSLGAAVAACGGEEEPATGPTPAADQSAFPVRITHKYGTTEVTARAQRVVTLGLSDQDAVLALGIKPVGVVDWFGERPFGKWPWSKPLWGDTQPEIVGERDDYNVEKIVALKPDLIIAQYSGMTKEQYDTLSKIAPVVAQPAKFDDYAAPWDEMTRMIGQALGEQRRVEDLIAQLEQRFAQTRQEHPELVGKTAAVVDPYEAGKYAVFAGDDPKAAFMTALGFRVPEAIATEAGAQNAIEISSERLDLVDVDRLLFLTADPAAESRVKADRVYQTLAVAREGRALFVPYEEPAIGAALSFYTVLSIPYAIEQMVPLLTAAPSGQ